ncbi:MAG TPA: (d)CMP kinase [Oceanithermus profundus]|uniref:Cytidylate kinase n=1 Tax=Oceanithermus profundus TaxID=187137 RepID=A0A7C4Z4Z2_9DEIN|nr:(d)CMP kinase [Oceanithermus profundus]
MDEAQPLIVTIDGPGASGKSSVARLLARALRVPYVSSGLLYRGVAYQVLRHGVDPDDEEAIVRLLERRPLRLEPDAEGNRVYAGDEDLTPHLHTDAVDAVVSAVARHPRVRAYVNERLREVPPPFVVEGRDMGTAVFPHAPYKFYLTASPEVRARRRARERADDVAAIEKMLRLRDERDAKQSKPAEDAQVIDTSELTLDQVVGAIMRYLPAGLDA